MNSSSRSSVIIIGAGASGILAAKVLAENGIEDMLILEASDRIGGRIRKESFAGVPVELGAGWIAGVGGKIPNPIWEMANTLAGKSFLVDSPLTPTRRLLTRRCRGLRVWKQALSMTLLKKPNLLLCLLRLWSSPLTLYYMISRWQRLSQYQRIWILRRMNFWLPMREGSSICFTNWLKIFSSPLKVKSWTVASRS